MSRIAERMQRGTVVRPRWAGGFRFTEAEVAGIFEGSPPVIDATNVAEYLHTGTDQEVWDFQTDFPCVAPPFQVFFVEYASPRRTWNKEEGMRDIDPAFGGAVVRISAPPVKGKGGMPPMMAAETFIEMSKGDFVGPLDLVLFGLTDDGRVSGLGRHVIPGLESAGPDERVVGLVESVLQPALLAVSFMHCKNTKVTEAPRSEKLERARARRGDARPALRYHTLEIEPMKQVLRTQGQADAQGLRHALHVCRGHFADYRERGLFGRHKGVFWFGPQVRGTSSQGVVVKDYSVGAPRKGGADV